VAILDTFTQRATPFGRRPPAAVEIAPEGVLAAAAPAPGAAPSAAFAALPGGALIPGIAESNLRSPEVVAAALRSALDQVSPRSRSITIVIPDMAARVFVLDFDSLPTKAADVLPVLRFRLRKVAPFDVEQSAVSYQILSQERYAVKVLATIMPSAILHEYEGAVRAAGYEPGAVLPSALAVLAAASADEAILAVNLSNTSITTAIASGNDLLLYRTLDLPAEPEARLVEIQRGVAVAAAYYEDRLIAPPTQLHFAGSVDAREFARSIAEMHLSVVDLVPESAVGAMTAKGPVGPAGVIGALAGAA
jgi:type IV pilus assembly protein PilM